VGSQTKHTARDTVTPVCNVRLLAQKKPLSLQILSQNINTQYALATLISAGKQVFGRNDTVQTDKFLTVLCRAKSAGDRTQPWTKQTDIRVLEAPQCALVSSGM